MTGTNRRICVYLCREIIAMSLIAKQVTSFKVA